MTKPFRRTLFDIETNGLLPGSVAPYFAMDRIHSLVAVCLDTRAKKTFVDERMLPLLPEELAELAELGHTDIRPLREGIALLLAAEFLAGHNILNFDIPAIQLIYPDFEPTARLYDTLVMARMVFANVKETDYRMFANGALEGKLIGTQGLAAWGQRLGLHKGDYSDAQKAELKELHKAEGIAPPTDEELHDYVWGEWNVAMHDYMVLDADVNLLLWEKIDEANWSPQSVSLEHNIHALMIQQENNGFLFDIPKAKKLADSLRSEYETLSAIATSEIGKWFRPNKVITDRIDPAKGEDSSRRTWGDITVPKTTINRVKTMVEAKASGDFTRIQPIVFKEAPFVKVEVKEFNPNSRTQIIDRLKVLFGWEPADFTEKGSPKVDDEILRALAEHVPLAETLAEIFYVKKRLGQIADGQNGWLKLVRADSRIHGRVNVGGAVSGRATHAAPNVSQVPGVNAVEFSSKEAGEAFLAAQQDKANPWGAPIIVSHKWNERKQEMAVLTRGRTGGYGWDCRELFIANPGYKLVGCDLSGVEFRCLASLCFPFDDGEMVDIVLNGDIHQKNADLCGISRSLAKRALYACLYGGGDAKLGSLVEPFASEARQKVIGAQLRDKLMRAMPSLKAAIREIHREMRRNKNTIRGLDGRRLYVRSKHSALNLRLQSDGALIAKKWNLLVDDAFYAEGWDHHIDGDYSFVNWSHDEHEYNILPHLAERAAAISEAMAPEAGKYFNFMCPITAESKIGNTWAEVH